MFTLVNMNDGRTTVTPDTVKISKFVDSLKFPAKWYTNLVDPEKPHYNSNFFDIFFKKSKTHSTT